MSAQGTPWTEHRTPEGRPYWYHAIERRSVWEKPSELKTPRERALEATPWKEYKSGDRSYYVHSITKQSTWTLPAELKQILDQYPIDGPAPASSSAAASPHVASPALGRSPIASQSPFPATDRASPNRPSMNSPNATPYRGEYASGSNTPLPTSSRAAPLAIHQTMSGTTELNFKGDKEAAETAFIQLLRDTGVDIDWTWETTMRTIITNPLYKALKTIAERKAAFNKHIASLREQRAAESRGEMGERLKPAFAQLINGEKRLKSYSSYATAKKFLGNTTVWKQAVSEEEAKSLFEAVMKDRRDKERVEESKIKRRNMEMLMALLKTFEADVFTRWRDAHRTILESQEYRDDEHLASMDLGDMLVVFEELIRGIEKDADAAQRKEVELKRRKERKNRDAFKSLLRNLKEEGKIAARTTWGQVWPLIKDDNALLRCVGQPGSTPLDLFYDLVDELDQELEKQTADALQHISSLGHTVTPGTTESEFLSWTSSVDVPTTTLQQIYTELVAYLCEEEQRKAADERRRLERKFRHRIEDLRYAFKKVEPALELDADWEVVRGRVEGLEEFKAAEGEDERVPRWAWEKFVRRQKEKEREGEGGKRKDAPEKGGRLEDGEDKTEEVSVKRVKRVKRDDDETSEPEEGQV